MAIRIGFFVIFHLENYFSVVRRRCFDYIYPLCKRFSFIGLFIHLNHAQDKNIKIMYMTFGQTDRPTTHAHKNANHKNTKKHKTHKSRPLMYIIRRHTILSPDA